MTSSALAHLSDQIGTIQPNTLDEATLALQAALRAATSADEAAAFRAMLGLGGAR